VRRLPFAVVLAIMLASCGSSGGTKPAAAPLPTTTVAGPTTPGAGPTPFDVLQAENDHLNQGDVAGSIAYFAPEAILITPLGGCSPCVGRELIREHWSGAAANQTEVALSDPRTVGDIVTVHTTIRSPQFPTGITRAIGSAIVSVRDGKITRLSQQYDTHDRQTATLLAIIAGARGRTTTPTHP
jgi:hypothetical protein